jgi:polar amino acid transport system substrate-binding protein
VRVRVVLVLIAFALGMAGCGSATSPLSVTISPIEPAPETPLQGSPAPVAENADCGDREASLRPGPMPTPGEMPPGSTMATIAARRRLIAGVDQDTKLFGSRNPQSGKLEGFDVDVAREIARAIFGDPDRIDPQVVEAKNRESALESGDVDIVVRTYSITCERKNVVQFSTPYYIANQRILAVKGSRIDSVAALSGKRVCAVVGTTSLPALAALAAKPMLVGVNNWTDCLVMLQQGQVDAISTDDTVLRGLAAQDPNTEIVGESMGVEPYGVGVRKENDDLVRFVNGVLDRMRVDGTWERLYEKWLRSSLGPSPGPPPARYQD